MKIYFLYILCKNYSLKLKLPVSKLEPSVSIPSKAWNRLPHESRPVKAGLRVGFDCTASVRFRFQTGSFPAHGPSHQAQTQKQRTASSALIKTLRKPYNEEQILLAGVKPKFSLTQALIHLREQPHQQEERHEPHCSSRRADRIRQA